MHNPIVSVAFEKNTGKIIAIGPGLTHENKIDVSFSEVAKFKTGEASKLDYCVTYDIADKNYKIIKKEEQTKITANDILYEIEKTNNADITVVQNKSKKRWEVILDKQTQHTLQKNNFSSQQKISFSVTALGDANILYRYMSIDFNELVKKGQVEIDFIMSFEKQETRLSIYTRKIFDTYSYEVIDEV